MTELQIFESLKMFEFGVLCERLVQIGRSETLVPLWNWFLKMVK